MSDAGRQDLNAAGSAAEGDEDLDASSVAGISVCFSGLGSSNDTIPSGFSSFGLKANLSKMTRGILDLTNPLGLIVQVK